MERIENKETVKQDTRKLALFVVCMLMFVSLIFGIIPMT